MKKKLCCLLALALCLALAAPCAWAESPAGEPDAAATLIGPDETPAEVEEFDLEAPEGAADGEQDLMTEDMLDAAEDADAGVGDAFGVGDDDGPRAVEAAEDRTELSGWLGHSPLEFAHWFYDRQDWDMYYTGQVVGPSNYPVDHFSFIRRSQGGENSPVLGMACVIPYSWRADLIEIWHDSSYALMGFYPGMPGDYIEWSLTNSGWTIIGGGDNLAVYGNQDGHYLQVYTSYYGGTVEGLRFFNQRFQDTLEGWWPGEGFLGSEYAQSIALDPSGAIEIPVGQFLCVLPSVQPANALLNLWWSTSDENVLGLNRDLGRGIFRANNPGVVTVTASAYSGANASLLVRVVDPNNPPERPAIMPYSVTLPVRQSAELQITPAGCAVTSDNPGVATVSVDGVVTGVSPGTATITGTDPFGYWASCLVTVKAAPKKVTLNKSKIKLKTYGSYRLKAKLPKGSMSEITYRSSNLNVATVDETGLVRGVAPGTATITARTYNGKTAKCKVTVKRGKSKTVKYRALLIANGRFPGTSMSTLPAQEDVGQMAGMLNAVKGPAGNDWMVYADTNCTRDTILSYIMGTLGGASEKDVSLFYIGTHGNSSSSIVNEYSAAGSLATYPDGNGRYNLSLPDLAECLNRVPGKVIVMIDACGSGAAVVQPKGAAAFDPGTFNDAVVNAFADYDAAVMAPGDGSGAMAQDHKFYVLTSAAYREMGWTTGERKSVSYFVKWICEAVGKSGKMPADGNRDKYLTLSELHRYLSDKGERQSMRDSETGKNYKQHAQVYPRNSAFDLFFRK